MRWEKHAWKQPRMDTHACNIIISKATSDMIGQLDEIALGLTPKVIEQPSSRVPLRGDSQEKIDATSTLEESTIPMSEDRVSSKSETEVPPRAGTDPKRVVVDKHLERIPAKEIGQHTASDVDMHKSIIDSFNSFTQEAG